MGEWKKNQLGEVCNIFAGGDAPDDTSSIRTDTLYVPVYSNGISCKGLYGYTSKSRVSQEAITISARGTIGAVFFRSEPFFPIVRLITVFPKSSELDTKFLYYRLLLVPFAGDGSAVKQLTVPMISEYDIDFPLLPTQRKIAAVLSSLDDKIENNRKICANLEAQAQAIFKSWFVDFEPFGGKMPHGWNVCLFDQICKPRNEKGSPQLLNMYAVTNTGILPRAQIFKKDLAFSGTACKVMHKGDLVFGMSRSILNWGVMKDEIGGVSSAYHIYSVVPDIPSNYIESYIAAHIREFTTLIKPASREGQGFDAEKLMTMELGFPSKKLLEAYYDLVKPILQLLAIRRREGLSLSLLRDALLPKLMNGEVDVEKVKVA